MYFQSYPEALLDTYTPCFIESTNRAVNKGPAGVPLPKVTKQDRICPSSCCSDFTEVSLRHLPKPP